MNKIYPDYKGNLRKGNIDIFLEIVIDNYLEILKIQNQEKNDLKKFNDEESFEDLNNLNVNQEQKLIKILENGSSKDKLVIQSIVMLTVFFESLINEIGSIELGQRYFRENIDKLSILSKWEIVLRIAFGKTLDKESQYYENLKKLISTRNSLVHYKTKKLTDLSLDNVAEQMTNSPDYFLILQKNILSLKDFFKDFEKIDSEKKTFILFDIGGKIRRLKTYT